MSKVGYKNPPVESQFKPGKSGNPKGRPKGSISFSNLISKALNEKIVVSEKGEQKAYTAKRVITKTLVNKALKGDMKAVEVVMKLEGLSQQDKQIYERQDLSPEAEQAILDRFAKRQNGGA